MHTLFGKHINVYSSIVKSPSVVYITSSRDATQTIDRHRASSIPARVDVIMPDKILIAPASSQSNPSTVFWARQMIIFLRLGSNMDPQIGTNRYSSRRPSSQGDKLAIVSAHHNNN